MFSRNSDDPSTLPLQGAINLRKALQSIDTRNDIFQLLDIARVGGQIGIATAELEGFTRSTNKIVVALGDEFTEGARQVATELGGIGKAFGIFEEMGIETGMLRIGNAINKLSQEGLATAPYLSNFTKRVAAMGRTANASVGDIIGMAAGFKEVNLPVERTSSGMERVFLKMGTDLNRFAQVVKLNTRVFRQEFEKNGIEALIMFAKALEKIAPSKGKVEGSSELRLNILKELGLAGVGASKAIQSLATNTDDFRKRMKMANEAMQNADSILKEYSIKNNSLMGLFLRIGKAFDNLSIAIGDAIKGSFSYLIVAFQVMFDVMTAIVSTGIGRFLSLLLLRHLGYYSQ